MGQAKVFAHRGSSGQWPENTMLAFRKTMEEGADGIENDVHLSKDGEVMIIHDESLSRTTGREPCQDGRRRFHGLGPDEERA